MNNSMIPVSPRICNDCSYALKANQLTRELAYPRRDNLTQWWCAIKVVGELGLMSSSMAMKEAVLITRNESTVPLCCMWSHLHESEFMAQLLVQERALKKLEQENG